jgi:NAD-dependent SIR2 family protein deacetylase
MGTSLLVYPVASLPQMVGANAVRMLWNREATGCFQFIAPGNDEGESSLASRTQQVETRGYRDIFHQDDCDSAARQFAEMIGKSAEMNLLLAKYA